VIIEYLMGYNRPAAVWHCGIFRDWDHFTAFRAVEASYGRNIYDTPKVIKG
jgi:hypothetical protein